MTASLQEKLGACLVTQAYDELYVFLERHLNDGSPSGYAAVGPAAYSPDSDLATFDLPLVALPRPLTTTVGQTPGWARSDDPLDPEIETAVPVHPRYLWPTARAIGSLTVSPTASVRTVAVLSSSGSVGGWIKLHYPWDLGRFRRDLYHYKWLGSIEADRALAPFAERLGFDHLRESFGWYTEFCAPDADARGWGTLGRELPDSGYFRSLVIPAFSLLARAEAPDPFPLLNLIRDHFGWSSDEVFNRLAEQALTIYVRLATEAGLLPECNAQNVLFAIASDGRAVTVGLRDMGDVFKDLLVRKDLGLSADFCDYKTIDETSRDVYERRSFSFDFKLCGYFLLPLLEAISTVWGLKPEAMRARLRRTSLELWRPFGVRQYFADEYGWYSYRRERRVGRLSYLRNPEPPLR